MSLLINMDVGPPTQLHLSASAISPTRLFTPHCSIKLSGTANTFVLNIIHVQGLNHAEIDFIS